MRLLKSLILSTALFAATVFSINSYASTTSLTGYVYSSLEINGSHTAISNAKVSLKGYSWTDDSMMGDSISYSATTDANGKFVIDSVMKGEYFLQISAQGYTNLIINRLRTGWNTDSLVFFLNDTAQTNGGKIKGKVELENQVEDQVLNHNDWNYNDIFTNAVVTAISADNSGKSYSTFAMVDGDYSLKVPAGKYYVMASLVSANNLSINKQYYKNTDSLADAEVITVMKNQTMDDINFYISPRIHMATHKVTFKGSVSSNMNTPLSNATIKIWSSSEGEHEEEHGGRFIASTQTDALGQFSITLDSLSQYFNTFIVSAEKDGYKMQFYNGEDVFYKADLLTSVSDTTFAGLNFYLMPEDTSTTQKYSISGTVTDTANMGISGAFVILKDSSSKHMRVAVSDSSGNFTISALNSGAYYMMAFARGYHAEFYMNADKWENAKTIQITSSSVTGIHITLQMSNVNASGGRIIGEVHSKNGAALPGVLITLKSSANITVGTAVTDRYGSYSISGVAKGSYTITASTVSDGTRQQSTTYDPNNGSTQVNNFTMSPSTATGIKSNKNSVPDKFVLDNNYPNPFNPSTVIKFSIPEAAHVKLIIYNILGQKVAELVNGKLAAGIHTYIFDASNLSSGVYLYRLEAKNFTSTKKMILEK